MKKCFSILALFAIILYTSEAISKICFVLDDDCQTGNYGDYGDDDQKCSVDYNLTTQECSARKYQTCSDSKGDHYKKGECKSGYCEVDTSKYTCESGSCDNCCKNPKCSSSIYSDTCKSPKVVKSTINKDRYCVELGSNCTEGTKVSVKNEVVDCECPDTYDAYCTGDAEIGSGASCDGKYASCVCGKGYQATELSCEFGAESKTITGGTMCYKCKEDPGCPEGQMKESVAKTTCSNGYAESSSYGKGNKYKCYTCAEPSGATCPLDSYAYDECQGKVTDSDMQWCNLVSEDCYEVKTKTCEYLSTVSGINIDNIYDSFESCSSSFTGNVPAGACGADGCNYCYLKSMYQHVSTKNKDNCSLKIYNHDDYENYNYDLNYGANCFIMEDENAFGKTDRLFICELSNECITADVFTNSDCAKACEKGEDGYVCENISPSCIYKLNCYQKEVTAPDQPSKPGSSDICPAGDQEKLQWCEDNGYEEHADVTVGSNICKMECPCLPGSGYYWKPCNKGDVGCICPN